MFLNIFELRVKTGSIIFLIKFGSAKYFSAKIPPSTILIKYFQVFYAPRLFHITLGTYTIVGKL